MFRVADKENATGRGGAPARRGSVEEGSTPRRRLASSRTAWRGGATRSFPYPSDPRLSFAHGFYSYCHPQ